MKGEERRNGLQGVIPRVVPPLVVLVGMLLLSRMVGAAPEEQSRATGRSYSVPIPNGFIMVKTERNPQVAQLRSAGGLAFVQREKPSFENGFLASITVVPTQIPTSLDLQDKATCVILARGGAASVGGKVQTVQIAELPSGRHCQYTILTRHDQNRAATETIFSTPKETWVVTCRYDSRDSAAISACTQVVDGWERRR